MAYSYVGGVVGNYLLLLVPPAILVTSVCMYPSFRHNIITYFPLYFVLWLFLEGISIILVSSVLLSYHGIVSRSQIQQGACLDKSMLEGETSRYTIRDNMQKVVEDGRVQGIALMVGLTLGLYIVLVIATWSRFEFEHRMLGYIIGFFLMGLMFVHLTYIYNFFRSNLYQELSEYNKTLNTINNYFKTMQNNYKNKPDDFKDNMLIKRLTMRLAIVHKLDGFPHASRMFQDIPYTKIVEYISFKEDKSLFDNTELKPVAAKLEDTNKLNPSKTLRDNNMSFFISLIFSLFIYGLILFHNFYKSGEMSIFILSVIIIFMTVTYMCSMTSYA